MRCNRHGRACSEPPALISHPSTSQRYQVLELVGRGGFARVYSVAEIPTTQTRETNLPTPRSTTPRGEHGSLAPRQHAPVSPQTHRFALKVISKCRLGDTTTGREALRNEVSIHRQLQHPAIVRLVSYWEDQFRIYLLMHYIDGPQLEKYVQNHGRLSEPEASVYAANILEALSYLHANRIVHRDLKLANLLLSQQRTRAMLCDFGLAAHLDTLRASKSPSVCGTPNYVAPELLTPAMLSKPSKRHTNHLKSSLLKGSAAKQQVGYTTSADLWSMGVVLYTMLVGTGPFDSEDLSRTFRRIRAARFTFPIGLKISPVAKNLIRSLLSEDHTKRPTADQALQHPFFSTNDVPKLFPRPGARELNVNALAALPASDDRSHNESHRADRANGRMPGPVMAKNRRLGVGPSRRSADSRRWSGSQQEASHQPSNSMFSQGAYVAPRNERPSSVREDRDRSAHHFSTRTLSRAAKERSTSLCTAESLQRSNSSGEGRRSSLNSTRALNNLDESRRSAASASRKRSSLRISEKRNEVLNLSVTLSSAILRGRRFLDEEKSGKAAELAKKARFDAVATHVDDARYPPLVRRWLDYTCKYGFATMMEDGRTSCCFNDGSIMFFASESVDIPDFAYIPARSASTNNGENSEREKQKANDISKKACLCTLFADMMVEGGRGSMYDLPSACNVSFLKPDAEPSMPGNHTASGDDHKDIVHVREWVRFRQFRAAAFRLSNHSIHVKFDVGDDRCDDFLFTPADGMLLYRGAKAGTAWRCQVRNLGEFSALSEYVHKQLEVCSQAISRFLE